MTEHAHLSPSGGKRWMACVGSLTLEAAFPNHGNVHSDIGTAKHAVASMCLTEHWRAARAISTNVPVHAPGELTRTVMFTDDMAAEVQGYVDCVRAKAIGHQMFVEHRVDFSETVGVPESFGTADCIILVPLGGFGDGCELVVIDAKFGFVRVDPEQNSQGMLYALGALAELSLSYDIRQVTIGIYQPAHGGLREWTCSVEQLLAFGEIARERAQLVVEAQAARGTLPADLWETMYLHPSPNEDDCRFCRAMATCPAMARKVQAEVGSAFSVVDEPLAFKEYPREPVPYESPLTPATMVNSTLARAMDACGLVEDWIKAVRAEVERRLLAGEPVAGWGLELGRQGNRVWKNAQDAEDMLRKKFRLKIEDAFDLSLKSPTSIEKLHEAKGIGDTQWKKLQPLIGRAPAKPSVKPASAIKVTYVPPQLSSDAFAPVASDTLAADEHTTATAEKLS